MGLIEHWLVKAGTPDIWKNPTDKTISSTNNDVRQFRLKEDLLFAFYIVVSGCTLAALVFIAELVLAPKLLFCGIKKRLCLGKSKFRMFKNI